MISDPFDVAEFVGNEQRLVLSFINSVYQTLILCFQYVSHGARYWEQRVFKTCSCP